MRDGARQGGDARSPAQRTTSTPRGKRARLAAQSASEAGRRPATRSRCASRCPGPVRRQPRAFLQRRDLQDQRGAAVAAPPRCPASSVAQRRRRAESSTKAAPPARDQRAAGMEAQPGLGRRRRRPGQTGVSASASVSSTAAAAGEQARAATPAARRGAARGRGGHRLQHGAEAGLRVQHRVGEAGVSACRSSHGRHGEEFHPRRRGLRARPRRARAACAAASGSITAASSAGRGAGSCSSASSSAASSAWPRVAPGDIGMADAAVGAAARAAGDRHLAEVEGRAVAALRGRAPSPARSPARAAGDARGSGGSRVQPGRRSPHALGARQHAHPAARARRWGRGSAVCIGSCPSFRSRQLDVQPDRSSRNLPWQAAAHG